ncbi:rhomboid family intramembrane serine protease [Nocardiopsis algeriensis]|uniref:Membrane associated rhomboid family serine protease n=1 Tax=Nocardiopsis algeriensis TaxID=1478215 RepID=A0A841IPW6_9ACTN|nr:rhomboid family intramembrane serine protease [Nocardiopsis algeriensis]MBB6119306.1 membrane associated rhomboid family serine protease [Nocardiopsis algeriensis]
MAAIPLNDDHPVRRVPVVAYLLIAANVLAYLASPQATTAVWYPVDFAERYCAVHDYFLRWGAVPAEMFGRIDVIGPMEPGCAPLEDKSVWLSVLSSMFVHSGALHLLGNMVYLFVFGPVVEDRIGRTRFLLLYLATGLAAAYGFALGDPGAQVPMVGASGAVSGVLGAYLVVQFRGRVTTLVLGAVPMRLPGWAMVGSYFVLEYLLYVTTSNTPGSASGVAHAAHVWGFVAGVVAGLVVYRLRRRSGTRLSDVY